MIINLLNQIVQNIKSDPVLFVGLCVIGLIGVYCAMIGIRGQR
jgi:hypothetical protein